MSTPKSTKIKQLASGVVLALKKCSATMQLSGAHNKSPSWLGQGLIHYSFIIPISMTTISDT